MCCIIYISDISIYLCTRIYIYLQRINYSPQSMMIRSITKRAFSSSRSSTIGLVGVGKMGTEMSKNLVSAGRKVIAFDVTEVGRNAAESAGATVVTSVREIGEQSDIVLTMLPNDKVLRDVTSELLSSMRPGTTHSSCSTVSPHTSRELAESHLEKGVNFVASPIFARPDGVAAKQGVWMVSGDRDGVKNVEPVLREIVGTFQEFGSDHGAANIVKLCGNFLIASAIEANSEMCAFAESNGVNREEVMSLLNSTIFDCLIYRGYGNRIAGRKHLQDHDHPGFALELGLKDVSLVLDTAQKSGTPMPLGSLLRDRYLSSFNKGRGHLDWSSIGLAASEDSGVDVSDYVKNPRPE